jgi:xylulokinase
MALYLGLDSSTQSLKALLADVGSGRILAVESVNFGKDLPHFGCPEGVLENSDPLVKHSPPAMWLAALDLALERLHAKGAPMGEILGISGAGQQHGSVYLKRGADAVLAGLDPGRSLAEQLTPVFSRATSPIWMDSSTGAECAGIQAAIGPRLQEDTGSPAVERFTGPQIRRFFLTDRAGYDDTAKIHLVSSFLCSVLIGGHAPIDFGDGSGMNLLNLRTGDWDDAILDATAPGLREKLPPAMASDRVAGKLCGYFAKYGLRPGIPVVLWTGDNPSSLVGVGAARPGVAVISLGTSDTFFAAMPDMKTDPGGYGHVFGNPAGGFMSLICFKNGSLARDRMREECGADWQEFDSSPMLAPVQGALGNLLLPYYVPEITPRVLHAGVRASGASGFLAGEDQSATMRAIMEGQVCSMRLHSEWIGSFDKVRVTGGASRSDGLIRIIADVFQAEVEMISVVDASALGAALRAAQAAGGYAWGDLFAAFASAVKTVQPDATTKPAYQACLQNYRVFLDRLKG